MTASVYESWCYIYVDALLDGLSSSVEIIMLDIQLIIGECNEKEIKK